MKLIFRLSLVFIILSFGLQGQSCSLNPLYADSSFGVWPRPEENLPIGTGGEYYATDIQIKVPEYADQIDPSAPHYKVDWIRLDSIVGLPDGFNYSPNDPDATWNKNEQGCVLIYGTADTGTFPFIIYLTGQVLIGGVIPLKQAKTVEDYVIVLDTAATMLDTTFVDTTTIQTPIDSGIADGIISFSEEHPVLYPNPFTESINIRFNEKLNGHYNFILSNLNGQIVFSKDLDGKNKLITLPLNGISPGIYYYQLVGTKELYTGKLISK